MYIWLFIKVLLETTAPFAAHLHARVKASVYEAKFDLLFEVFLHYVSTIRNSFRFEKFPAIFAVSH